MVLYYIITALKHHSRASRIVNQAISISSYTRRDCTDSTKIVMHYRSVLWMIPITIATQNQWLAHKLEPKTISETVGDGSATWYRFVSVRRQQNRRWGLCVGSCKFCEKWDSFWMPLWTINNPGLEDGIVFGTFVPQSPQSNLQIKALHFCYLSIDCAKLDIIDFRFC